MLTFLVILSAIVVLYFNFLTYFKNRKSAVNFSFAVFGFCIFFWLVSFGIGYLLEDSSKKLLVFRIGYIGIIAIPLTFYNFVTKLVNFRKRSLTFSFIGLALVLFFYNFLQSGFLSGLRKYSWGFYPSASLPSHFFLLIYFFGIFSFALTLLFLATFTKFSKLSPLARVRVKYVLWGALVGSLGSVDFLGNYGVANFFPIGFLFMLIYPAILAYAIIKYRVLQINLAITRTGIFVTVYSLVLGIPFALVFFAKERLITNLGANWWIAPLICSTVLATIGPFIYLYVDRKAENRLLREQKGYQNALEGASGGMIRIKDLSRLLNLIVHVVTKTVRISHASIYLFDAESQRYFLAASRGTKPILSDQEKHIDCSSVLISWVIRHRVPILTEEIHVRLSDYPENTTMAKLFAELNTLNAALIVPSFVDKNLIGLIVLGSKRSEALYTNEDMAIFLVLANQAALAIENAKFYDEIRKTHEQLFQAEKLATIGTMADGLSHQINNRFHALSLISGDSLDILKTLDITHCDQGIVKAINDVKNGLERIQANVLQGGEVVRGLLKYSRPGEAGFEPVYFRDVISGAVDMVQYKIKFKEIEFSQNIPEDLPKLRGNLTQLQEVFFNMFDNAYDAIKERQVSLKEDGYKGKIEVVASLDDGNLKVVVSDNGMGVKDKDKKNLFTPFFTTKATAKKGTGLGLYVIEKIVASHNGKLSMESTYQSGTHVTVILPLAGPS